MITIGHMLGGLGEEIVFRGIVLYLLSPLGFWPAVLLSSAWFGVAHFTMGVFSSSMLYGFVAIGLAIPTGFGLAALRVRTNSLLPPALVHALTNIALAFYQHSESALVWRISVASAILWVLYGLWLLRSGAPITVNWRSHGRSHSPSH
jgi:membrane protease YdiL (CAAX protease family)